MFKAIRGRYVTALNNILNTHRRGNHVVPEENRASKSTERFARALDILNNAPAVSKSLYQTDVMQETLRLAKQPHGMESMASFAHQFEPAGVFIGGPWENATHLQPALVAGSLMADGIFAAMELLSNLRMYAIATETYQHPEVSADDALSYLREIMALNLGFIFPTGTEEQRLQANDQTRAAEALFQFLADHLSLEALTGKLLTEIKHLCFQRPIIVTPIIRLIERSKLIRQSSQIPDDDSKALQVFADAVEGPTPLSRAHPSLLEYRRVIKNANQNALETEARSFATSMRQTGLVSKHHALFIRRLNRSAPDVLPMAFDLTDKGRANFEENLDLVQQLITVAIHPSTCQSVYGLACMLNRGVLSSAPVLPGLRRLLELDIRPDLRRVLVESQHIKDGITENGILVSGVLSVLGQPLSVSQGSNPICQGTRGISLWAQHAQGYLLEIIARAARDGDIDMMFEGESLHSQSLSDGLTSQLHGELDPVSIALVPHLDRIYNGMMTRVSLRLGDGHKWVNPAFYGDWVSRGFASVVELNSAVITGYANFVRLFYATHHPDYNDDHELIYPNPVGIFITNVQGKLLGFHAVSIQRVAQYDGEYRIYLFNPNYDSVQNWGQGISPSVDGHDEQEGESSLPFHEFVSRLYAFHYNPYEQGDAYAVDEQTVQTIEKLAQSSWGQSYVWP